MTLCIDHGQTGRVIATVFQTTKPFEKDFSYITLRDCANNSTHSFKFRIQA
ncbi:Uncharacterised protein [Pluralibacter gergoviae]|nr:Uncharacterised protein [Pluralibacter gergoviae]